jgi:phage terminase Nu1 subunit (DNA packaging protein)
MAKPKLMGLREYARHRGMRLYAVQAAMRDGRIISVRVKGKPMIDWRKADAAWAGNTDPAKQNRKAKGVKSQAEGGREEPGDGSTSPGSFARARAVRETFQAKLTALKYQQAAGQFVPAQKVRDDWFRIGRTVRDALLNVPDRVSAKIAAVSGIPDFKVNQILQTEIRLILTELCNAEKRTSLPATDDDGSAGGGS